jgi:hypothetical protein
MFLLLIILIFITLASAISKLPKDGTEAPKYVGVFVIYYNVLRMFIFIKQLGSMLINDGRCTCEIKSRTAMEKSCI